MRAALVASVVILLASLAVPVAAQDLLPSAFSGWSSTAASTFRPETLEQLTGNDAALLREYGSAGAERRTYTRGGSTFAVTLYRMRDPTAAYGAYSFLRTDDMMPGHLTQYSAFSRRRALALIGNLLMDVSGEDVSPLSAELTALAAQLASRADKTPYPTLEQYLPEPGLIRNSDRYLLGPVGLRRVLPLGNGDWIGFGDGAEAALARYRVNGQEVSLLLVSFPTPQGAARKLEELGRWFPLNADQDVATDRPAPLFARRKGSLLALVAYAKSRTAADALLQQIHYETQVTWNEPKYKILDPGIGQILAGTFIGTGIILVFAFVAGLAFGGVRVIVKRILPGTVFDRPSTVEILQLGLTSKPIEAKDFY